MSPDPEKRLLLRPSDIPPTGPGWEVVSVSHPGAAMSDGEIVVLARIAERPTSTRRGRVPLPRWSAGGGPSIDWVDASDVEFIDPRIVQIKSTGVIRPTVISHLRVVRCDPTTSQSQLDDAGMQPCFVDEEYGVEDPRITFIDDRYWITYVAASRHGVATALASTFDFHDFERHGIIFPPEVRDVVLFPEKIHGFYSAIHRPNGASRFAAPEMWLARSSDLLQWGGYEPLLPTPGARELGRVGAGIPPLRVPEGWLTIYHRARNSVRPGAVGANEAAALLLDADDPARVLARSARPVLSLSEPFERAGSVPDSVLPTGAVQLGDSLRVVYGAAEETIAVADFRLDDLMASLEPVSAAEAVEDFALW